MSKLQTMVGTFMVVAILAAFTARPVAAQTCGDANGDDTVTITDGVQALRAAAGLSSTCGDGCDVDGSGAITVSDGVNILRRAAGIGINEACNFTGEEANGVVTPSLPIFGAITKTPGVGTASALALAAAAPECESGTLERFQSNAQSAVTFTACKIDGVVFDGTLGRVVLAQGVVLGFQDFKTTEVKTGKSLVYTGQLGLTDSRAGKLLAGTLTVVSSTRGTFTLQFVRILLAGDGSVRQGTLIYDLTKTVGGKIARIQIEFDETDELPVSILLRNKQVKQFILDRATSTLRPLL